MKAALPKRRCGEVKKLKGNLDEDEFDQIGWKDEEYRFYLCLTNATCVQCLFRSSVSVFAMVVPVELARVAMSIDPGTSQTRGKAAMHHLCPLR